MARTGPAILAVLCLASCGAEGPGGSGAADTCNAREYRDLIGDRVADLAALSQAAPRVRYVYPGQAVTEDDRPDRLNIVFDGSDRVVRVYCG